MSWVPLLAQTDRREREKRATEIKTANGTEVFLFCIEKVMSLEKKGLLCDICCSAYCLPTIASKPPLPSMVFKRTDCIVRVTPQHLYPSGFSSAELPEVNTKGICGLCPHPR